VHHNSQHKVSSLQLPSSVYILFVPHREAYTSIEVYDSESYNSTDSLAITPSVREGRAMESTMCRMGGKLSGIGYSYSAFVVQSSPS